MNLLKIQFLLIFLLLNLVSCSNSNNSCDKQSVYEVANKYLEAEKNNSWDTTYDLRLKEYRSIISREKYIEQMNTDARNWKMLSFSLLKDEIVSNDAILLVEVKEKVPKGFIPNDGEGETVKFSDTMRFFCDSGKWLVVEAPARSHFSLNKALVYPN